MLCSKLDKRDPSGLGDATVWAGALLLAGAPRLSACPPPQGQGGFCHLPRGYDLQISFENLAFAKHASINTNGAIKCASLFILYQWIPQFVFLSAHTVSFFSQLPVPFQITISILRGLTHPRSSSAQALHWPLAIQIALALQECPVIAGKVMGIIFFD